MHRDCPCYELTDGCGCECCTEPRVTMTDNISQNVYIIPSQPSLPACVEPDEYPCECNSVNYMMLQSGIDPVAARNSGGSYSHDKLVNAYNTKQGRE